MLRQLAASAERPVEVPVHPSTILSPTWVHGYGPPARRARRPRFANAIAIRKYLLYSLLMEDVSTKSGGTQPTD
jgi:hypothetical protein